jgi:hydrogenase expression/formation protein HypC
VCLAIPGRIDSLDAERPDLATVDVVGVKRVVSVALLEPGCLAPGDWVLIHVGFAMSRIDEAEARATLAALEEMGQIWAEELETLRLPETAGG